MVDWNERLIDWVLSSKFRASLVPAAAVIPAELEMGNIVAVKTYVVTSVLIAALCGHVIELSAILYVLRTPRVN